MRCAGDGIFFDGGIRKPGNPCSEYCRVGSSMEVVHHGRCMPQGSAAAQERKNARTPNHGRFLRVRVRVQHPRFTDALTEQRSAPPSATDRCTNTPLR